MSPLRSLLALAALASTEAFAIGVGSTTAARTNIQMGAINDLIDKENPKVVNTLKVSEMPLNGPGLGKKAVYCRCWKSKTFPYCDAAHVKHNKECGDNVGPLIIDNDAYEGK